MRNACLLSAAVNLVPIVVENSVGEQGGLQTKAGCTALMVDDVMDLQRDMCLDSCGSY